MLPFRHSNKNSENMEPPAISLTRKSTRPSIKCPDLPYNGSRLYYNSPAPSVPGYPAPSMQFRQRTRPLHLQLNQPTSSNTLQVPRVYGRHVPLNTRPIKIGGSSNPLIPPPHSHPPVSPGLDQVLTEVRPGPNVVWFCERKRPKPTLWSYRNVLICIFVLLTVGYCVYKMFGSAPDTREGLHLEVVDGLIRDDSRKNSYVFQEKHIEEVEIEKPSLIIPDVNNTKEIRNGSPAARMNILYSINEDFESTVEVIEG